MTLEHLETLIAFAVVILGVSLIITVLTQMVSALLGLRGTHLRWGLKTLFNTVSPKIKGQVEAILRNPIISDSFFSRFRNRRFIGGLISRWTLASAIRPDELARILTDISATQRANQKAQETNDNAFDAKGDTKNAKVATEEATEAGAIAEAIDKLLGEVDPEVERQMKLVRAVAEKVAPGATQQFDQHIEQLVEKVRSSAGKLETAFNAAMDRVSARFALHMRLWTVLFAGLIAFGVHLDSLKLLDQLSSNPQLRSSLADSAEAMMKEAATVIKVSPGGEQASGPSAEPLAYTAAMNALKKSEPDATKNLGEVPNDFASLDSSVKWLEPRLIADENGKKALIAEYTKLVSTELVGRAQKIRSLLESSGFQLIPRPYPGVFTFEGKRNVLGMLISWALLSLGAPFWFNALKSLSSLRPVLATAQPPKGQTATT